VGVQFCALVLQTVSLLFDEHLLIGLIYILVFYDDDDDDDDEIKIKLKLNLNIIIFLNLKKV